MSSKCVLDKDSKFYDLEVDGKGSLFEFVMEEGVYAATDDLLVFYGMFSSITEEVHDKDKKTFELTYDKPIKITFLLKDSEIKFKDKSTGEEKTWKRVTMPEYALVAKLIKQQEIEPGKPFKGSINFAISDAFQTALETKKFKNVTRTDEWLNEQLRLNYVDCHPIEKLSFEVPSGLTEAAKRGRTYTPAQTEKERLNERLAFLKQQLVGEDKQCEGVLGLMHEALSQGIFTPSESGNEDELIRYLLKLIMG